MLLCRTLQSIHVSKHTHRRSTCVVYRPVCRWKNNTCCCKCTVTEVIKIKFKLLSPLLQVIPKYLPVNKKQQKWHQNKECVSLTKEPQKTSHYVEMSRNHRYVIFCYWINSIQMNMCNLRQLKSVNYVKIKNF